MTCKIRPLYDLQCVWWDVKPCSAIVKTDMPGHYSLQLTLDIVIGHINNAYLPNAQYALPGHVLMN